VPGSRPLNSRMSRREAGFECLTTKNTKYTKIRETNSSFVSLVFFVVPRLFRGSAKDNLGANGLGL
jgi:hypothetical protein